MNLTLPNWLDETISGIGNIAQGLAEISPLLTNIVIATFYIIGIAVFAWSAVLLMKVATGSDPRGRGPASAIVVAICAILMMNLPSSFEMTMRTGGMDATYESQATLCANGSKTACEKSLGGVNKPGDSQLTEWINVAFSILTFVGFTVGGQAVLRAKRIGEGNSQGETPASCAIQFVAGVLLANISGIVGMPTP